MGGYRGLGFRGSGVKGFRGLGVRVWGLGVYRGFWIPEAIGFGFWIAELCSGR